MSKYVNPVTGKPEREFASRAKPVRVVCAQPRPTGGQCGRRLKLLYGYPATGRPRNSINWGTSSPVPREIGFYKCDRCGAEHRPSATAITEAYRAAVAGDRMIRLPLPRASR